MIFVQLIQSNLTTRLLGREVTYYPFTDSTNDDLWELVDDKFALPGHLVITDHQKVGKGRQGREWNGAAGVGLPFSVLLQPDWEIDKLGLISLAAGVAVTEAMMDFDVEASLKWPNDVMVGDKKLAGMLAENRGGQVALGIGINANQEAADFPDDLRDSATSVLIETGQAIQRERLMADIVNGLESLLESFPETIGDRWTALCGHMNKPVKFHGPDGMIEGTFEGLNEYGMALINSGSGAVAMAAGDLSAISE